MNTEKIIKELDFKFTRSSGAGGQHVNKVSSKVTLHFDLMNSQSLSDDEKSIVIEKLKNKINKEGQLVLSSQATRSQHRNKEIIINLFIELLKKSLQPKKIRKKSRRPESINLKRLERKRNQALKKKHRRPPSIE